MKRTLRKIALFAMFIMLQTSWASASDNTLLTEQDKELMQKNPDLEFISLDDDVRQAILEVAQLDQDMQVSNSAYIEALQFIDQGFTIIPHELAIAIAAQAELKEAEQAANDRGGCKTKCFNNLRVKNLLTANLLQVCGGADVSGGLTVYGNFTQNPGTSPNCRSSRACNTTPINTINAATVYNGPVTLNCNAALVTCLTDAAGVTSICLSDPAESVAMTVDKVLKWTLSPNGGIAHGDRNLASGANSVASGFATSATAPEAHAEGYNTTASGYTAHAEGYGTQALGESSHSEGLSTTSEGYSHAEGFSTNAIGQASHAEGNATHATGFSAHAECGFTTASGSYSHAEGLEATASGFAAHAEGYLTNANNSASHAEGSSATASGNAAHSEGLSTKASGSPSHAEGQLTVASNFSAHAEGLSTIASGTAAHAEGGNTTASGNFSHAAGQHATAGHNNAYCWSDGSVFGTSAPNQFIVKATGTTGGVPGTGIIFNNGAAHPVTTMTSGTATTWSYTPGNPANWVVVPTSVAQALDRLAAKVTPV